MMIIIPGFHRASQSYLAARVQCSPDIGIADTDRVLQRLIQQQTTTTTKMSTMVMVMMEHHGRWWRNDRSRSRLWSQIWIVIRNVKTRTMLILTITTTNNNNSIRNINDNNEEDNGKRMKKPEQASMSGLEWRRRLFCLVGFTAGWLASHKQSLLWASVDTSEVWSLWWPRDISEDQ